LTHKSFLQTASSEPEHSEKAADLIASEEDETERLKEETLIETDKSDDIKEPSEQVVEQKAEQSEQLVEQKDEQSEQVVGQKDEQAEQVVEQKDEQKEKSEVTDIVVVIPSPPPTSSPSPVQNNKSQEETTIITVSEEATKKPEVEASEMPVTFMPPHPPPPPPPQPKPQPPQIIVGTLDAMGGKRWSLPTASSPEGIGASSLSSYFLDRPSETARRNSISSPSPTADGPHFPITFTPITFQTDQQYRQSPAGLGDPSLLQTKTTTTSTSSTTSRTVIHQQHAQQKLVITPKLHIHAVCVGFGD
jgi:hypothetical protein